jgi:hypothetical protein
MHGASLHRRHRFRWVLSILWPYPTLQPAKSGVAPRLAARSPRRFALALTPSRMLPQNGKQSPAFTERPHA